MASRRERFSSGGTLVEGKKGDGIFVFDRRKGDSDEVSLELDGLTNFKTFRDKIRQIFSIADNDTYVITTTSREEIKDDESWGFVEAGDTLYILQSVTQELTAQAHERVNYLPHYDTIVKGGMYEYYASEGQNPLPYAIAELIDNALAATAENVGPRNIEIRLHLDENYPSRNMVIVLDNGKGMTSPQLNNWAIYRLSKFIRREKKGHGSDGEVSLLPNAPRSLNSDISYFGVGGKQAIFFIGNSTRMITRAHGSKDVHEMKISKDDFEQKEKNHEAIYSGYIRNRMPGDTSHVVNEDDFLKAVIEEEVGKESFTTVVISGINPTHVPYLKTYMTQWTRQLAHIYHYYIHGPNGNIDKDAPTMKQPGEIKTIDIMPNEWFSKINIEVRLRLVLTAKTGIADLTVFDPPYHVKVYIGSKQPRVINLRDIDDDMPTQFIRTAANTFEFKATVEYTGIVEGVLRYHPFLYDHETYPSDANDLRAEADPEDDHDYAASDVRPARGRRPIFECYWNGRLIPYSFVDEFDWCSVPKKNKGVPLDCYNRVSGVLWTNDKFQVSTNKLTFIDLELRLRDKNTTYGRILGKNDMKGQQARRLQEYAVVMEKRTDIGREFNAWLKECHERCDKQVKFSQYSGSITRPELVKHRQSPWSVYGLIEWDGKVFKKGTMVRIIKTVPVTYGTIQHFLLYGNHEGDVFATGGDISIIQEPRSLYNEVKTFPLSKLDRTANNTFIMKYIDEEVSKLPSKLVVSWPEGEEVTHGEKRPAGKTIGAIKVEIANRKGELISKLPGAAGGASRKLLVELKVIWHSCNGDEVIAQHISQHGRTWPYWFRKMENIKNLGPHTILLQAVLNESGASMFAGKELPCSAVRFTVIEAEPEKFSVGLLEGPFRVGVTFQIPLEFQDEFGHTTKPTSTLKPTLHASDLELTYDDAVIEGSHLVLKDIIATGKVPSTTGMNVQLMVTIPGLPADSQTLKIRLLPGVPHTLVVTPDAEVIVENGHVPSFEVEVRDCAGNVTTQPRLQVMCKFVGASGLPAYTVDCSSEGRGVLSGTPLLLKKMNGEQTLTARIEIPGFKAVGVVERSVKVLPSSQAASITVTYLKDEKTETPIRSGQDISVVAGELLGGLKFQVLDEAGRVKPCDKSLASNIKVNWTPKLSKDLLMAGSLPDVRAPTTLQDSKYCHISLTDGSGIDFSFNVKPVPGEPAQLKCRCSGSNQVRLGETLGSDIQVSVQDATGNEIKKFEKGVLKDLSVTGDGLVVKETVRMLGQKSGFNIEGIRFEAGQLGPRELKISWKHLTDYVRLEMVAGPPTALHLRDYDVTQPVVVYNGTVLSLPLLVQLVDEAGNPTAEANVRIQLTRDAGIKLTPPPVPVKTDKNGLANFGIPTVSGKKGVYEIQPKAFIGRTTLLGPKLLVSIQADFLKPVSLTVDYDKNAVYKAGETLPDFAVKVISEDETVMTSAKASHLMMRLRPVSTGGDVSTAKVITFVPDTRKKGASDGHFLFTNRKVPQKTGTYHIMFVYNDHKHQVDSHEIAIKVHPGMPQSLVPVEMPGTPTVSNARSLASRTLIRSLTLELRDQFDNACGSEFNGKVILEIINSSGVAAATEKPEFAGHSKRLTQTLTKGQMTLQNVVLEENTTGRDGQEYVLHCSVESPALQRLGGPALTYDIPFLFYNDIKKQSQMAALSKERDNLRAAIKAYRSLFDTTQQLINELRISLNEAMQEEARLKAELRRQGIAAAQLVNVAAVDSLLAEKTREKDRLLHLPRRLCGLHPAQKDRDVLGKIAHLAEVSDPEIARVLSWHMSADMDCVVTLNTRKAQDIYKLSLGKQQVLPLDSIYKKNLPDWSKPLPHQRIRPSWTPSGNPVYARNMLHFPHDVDKCKIVFGMLLGDTIILDTLSDANAYRQEIVKNTHCPTILTRQGDRIRSNGKFGGLMNKALPIEKLRGVVFAEPISPQYSALCSMIDLLQSYKVAVVRRETSNVELGEQLQNQKTSEMTAKYKECSEAETQLGQIEGRLGMTPTQAGDTASPAQLPHVEPPAKRSRTSLSPSVSVNGTTPTTSTPTRQSLRRMALNASSSERKRYRRT